LAEGLAATAGPAGPRLLTLEETETSPASPPAPPRPWRDPAHLAYVIFTSGSTGFPKAVMLPQGALINHLLAKIGELGLGPGDAVAQTTAQSFDMSVWQLLAALLAGGRVEVFGDEAAFDGNRLLPEAARRGVTVLDVVPSLLRAALDAGQPPQLLRLRWLMTGGDDVPVDLCRAWLERYPRVPFLNAYGPTECGDTVAGLAIREAPGEREVRLSIGRPITHLRLHVLDAGLRPVPVGVAGELVIGGRGLARGYLGDPGATARAFVPDPFATAPGERLYRTGDLARRRAGGDLEILGRLDHQVKIRGYRIEPGEIEAALRRQPGVAQCAVVARGSASGPRLVAYVVGEGGEPPDGATLATALRRELPEPWVPAAFVPLEALPLTPNGKLDRAALPEPEVPRTAGRLAAPRTPAEERLAELWAEVLGLEAVGVDEDFFVLGGHSLLAMRLVARVNTSFDVQIALPDLFEEPTVAGIARKIAETLLDDIRGLSDEELDELLRQEAEPWEAEEGR
jgi:amino acid adenylation domain-containing protein